MQKNIAQRDNVQSKGAARKVVDLVNYRLSEKIINSVSHGVGAMLAIAGTVWLYLQATETVEKVGIVIYGACLFLMFFNSALYHGVPMSKFAYVMRAIDHSSVFLCIAGTYTPMCLMAVDGKLGLILLIVIWVIALLGIGMKVVTFAEGKVKGTEKLSLILYLGMGWLSVLLIPNLITNIGWPTFFWLLGGGILYSVGVFFYHNRKIPYNHAIWHFFILAAAISHFVAVSQVVAHFPFVG